jgi:hypothetical protein
MVEPDDIRRKAENLYRACLRAWLEADETFFPRVVPARKCPDPGNIAGAVEWVRRLRAGSKEALGFGYTVEWQEVRSRTLGRNTLPARILFETREDYLRFVGKSKEFAAFTDAVTRLRTEFPELGSWVRSNVQGLIDSAPELDGLIRVVRFLREHPRPNLFPRELPLPVDTKFVERHKGLLREWLDAVLPPHAIRADEEHFERRYGLRYAEPHLHVRLLDPELQRELGFPCQEFSLPLETLATLPASPDTVLVVENRVNLLTLPPLPRTMGLGALGKGVTLLRYVPWLGSVPLVYWGDIDVQGFEILSSLRAIFPETHSILMDAATLDRRREHCTRGNAPGSLSLPHLTDAERAAYDRCRNENTRLEQERIPMEDVSAAIAFVRKSQIVRTGATHIGHPRGHTASRPCPWTDG